MGYLFCARGKYFPRLLPGLYLLPESIQRKGFRDQLHSSPCFRILRHWIQVLEQNEMGQIGRNGYMDRPKRICGRGDRSPGKGLVVSDLFRRCGVMRTLSISRAVHTIYPNSQHAILIT